MTGLTLSNSKAFTSMFGGTTNVSSTYGQGNTFIVDVSASPPG